MNAPVKIPSTQKLSRSDVQRLFSQPLLDLIFQAAQVHRANHDPSEIQMAAVD
jgi:biotin synthase